MERKKILGFGIGPVATSLFSVIAVPLVAWLFPVDDVGRLYLLQTVIAFTILLLLLGLDQAYVREFHEVSDKAELLRNMALPSLALYVPLALITVMLASPLASLLFADDDPRLVWILLGCVLVTLLSRQLSLILRMRERAFAFSMTQILPKAAFVAAICLFAVTSVSRSFLTLSLALLISLATVLVAYIWTTRGDWLPAAKLRFRSLQVSPLLKFGLPLVAANLTYSALIATSAYALRALSTLEQVGIFSVAMSVAGVASVIQAIFGIVWAPIVYRWAAQGQATARVESVARQVLAVVLLALAVGGSLVWIVDFLLPAGYGAVKFLVMGCMIQPLLYTLAEVTGIGFMIARRTGLAVWAALSALLTNLVLNALLVPTLGAAGSVCANAVAFVVFLAVRTELSAAVWLSYSRGRMYAWVALAVSLTILMALFGDALGWWVNALWFGLGVLVLWFFRRELREIVGALTRRGAAE